MLPAEYIRTALMGDEPREQRRIWDQEQQALKVDDWPALKNLAANNEPNKDENPEFENFDALASKLVQVPKSEIDEEGKQGK